MRYTTQFLLSALAAAQFPAPTVPEIAFLGRSNVGKSSLLNALVGEKAAKVSQTPGRTRAINFFALLDPRQQSKLLFADLPGYGYAKISKSISAEWPKFIDPYLAERETLKLCICLVDSNIPPQPNDGKLVDWLRHAGRDFLVVATKSRPPQRQRAHPKPACHQECLRTRRSAPRLRRIPAPASKNSGIASKPPHPEQPA